MARTAKTASETDEELVERARQRINARLGRDQGEGAAKGTHDEPAKRVRVRSMVQVTAAPVAWIWPRWLAHGKLHLFAGLAGDGKSTMIAEIAATGANVKAGGTGSWPDGTAATGLRTLFVLGEDGAEDTLKPRLELHGLTSDAAQHVFTLDAVLDEHGKERFFNAAKHTPELEAFIAEQGVDLLVIDPLSSAMPGSDRNGEGDVRDMLTPLVRLADARNVAILGIAHLRKGNAAGGPAQNMVLGSAAFTAVPRLVWQTATIDGRRYVGPTKSNLAVRPLALQWDREEDQPIQWLGETDKSMDALITGSTSPARGDKLESAKGWLLELLEGGSKPARDVQKLALTQGIADKTLRRAREDLGIEAFKIPHIANGPWYWRLPLTPEQWLHDQLRNGSKPEAELLERAKERDVSDGDLARAKAGLDVRSVEVAPGVWHWVLPGKHGAKIEDAHSVIHEMGIFDSSNERIEDAQSPNNGHLPKEGANTTDLAHSREDDPVSLNGQVRYPEDRRIEDAQSEKEGMGIFDSKSSPPSSLDPFAAQVTSVLAELRQFTQEEIAHFRSLVAAEPECDPYATVERAALSALDAERARPAA